MEEGVRPNGLYFGYLNFKLFKYLRTPPFSLVPYHRLKKTGYCTKSETITIGHFSSTFLDGQEK